MTNLKLTIDRVHAARYKMPFKKPFVTARKVNEDTTNCIIRVHASGADGHILGIGESQPKSAVTGDLGPNRAWNYIEEAAKLFVGKQIDLESQETAVASIRSILREADALADEMAVKENRDHPFKGSRVGFEMALLDLAGKGLEVPITELLGGRKRQHVTATAYTLSAQNSIEELSTKVEFWNKRVQINRVKVKGDLEENIKRLRAIHEANLKAGESRSIWIDFNESFRVEDGKALVQRLSQEIKVGKLPETLTIEQPYLKAEGAYLPELQRLADAAVSYAGVGDIRIMPDESIWDVADLEHIHEAGGTKAINIKMAKAGGMLASMDIADRAVALNPDIYLYIGGIIGASDLTAWALHHLAQAFPRLDYFSQTPPRNFLERITDPPLRVKKGTFTHVNTSEAGLGVKLEYQKLVPYIDRQVWYPEPPKESCWD